MENNENEYEFEFAYVGQKAPKFELEGVDTDGSFKNFSSDNHRGQWIVLFFYPLDFTFVCPTEIKSFSDKASAFKGLDAVVYGCSTDSVHSHKAWMSELGQLNFPLLADMTHEVSAAYNVLVDNEGVALRGTFIIDPEGVLRYASVNDLAVGRSVEETLRILTALQTGELCPVNWNPGEGTLGKA